MSINKVVKFIELLEAQNNQPQQKDAIEEEQNTQDFLQLAGIWKDRDISADALRREAWRIP